MINLIQSTKSGQWDGSADKGACSQAYGPSSLPWTIRQKEGKKKTSSDLYIHVYRYTYIHIQSKLINVIKSIVTRINSGIQYENKTKGVYYYSTKSTDIDEETENVIYAKFLSTQYGISMLKYDLKQKWGHQTSRTKVKGQYTWFL